MHISRRVSLRCILPIVIPFVMLAAASGQAASTTTALAVSPANSAASGTVVTLTATVVSSTAPVSPGQVRFCDAKAAHCEDSALLATAQLTRAGVATYKFRPGIGSHSYQAVFVGTKNDTKSTSSAETLDVTGLYPTTTSIASSGSVGNYTLTATVVGTGSPARLAPTSPVSFLDTTNGNASLGTAVLGTAAPGENFASASPDADGLPIVGDFNGDGIPDLAVLSFYGNSVTVLLGKGDGTFTQSSFNTIGGYPSAAAVGDFNGDGIADLAVADSSDNTVTVLLGNGDGTFTAKPAVSVGARPFSIAAGDFNGDGFQDLATVNLGDNTATVLLGNGDGTFTPEAAIAVGSEPESIAVGDFNGDGIPDLATANSGDSTATVLLGNGDGTFSTKSTPSVGTQPSFITVADFNGDGVPDIAVSYFEGVSVFTGKGDGTFTAGFTFNDDKAFTASEGDFNGDGIQDLAVIDYENGVGTVTLLLGNGDGAFTAQTSSGPDVSPSGFPGIVVGDFNGDGLPDLAMSGSPLLVLLNQLTQTATASLSDVSLSGSETHQVVASYPGDVNYNSSTSSAIPLLAAQIATQLNLSSSVDSSIAGTPITLTAMLSPFSQGTFTTNAETITFYDGQTSIGIGTLSAGVATLTIATLPPGNDTLTAAYSGDVAFNGSNSNNAPVTVSKVPTSLQLYSIANPSAPGASITLSAVLSPYNSPGNTFTATGETVTFYNGGTSLGTATLSFLSGYATFPVATLTVASLPDGTDSLTASYPGDSDFAAAASNAVAQAVNVPFETIPGFVVTVDTDTTAGVAANCTNAPAPNCSLRDALAAANAAGSGTITFDATVFATPQTITLSSAGGLNIPPHTTITGPTKGSGPTLTNLVTVSGGGPVFTVNEFAANTAISGLAITGGAASEGGGILNSGILTVSDCTISGNSSAGLEFDGDGGGIANSGVMTLINSAVTGNSADGSVTGANDGGPSAFGGGIENKGTLTILNSTIVGNSASAGATVGFSFVDVGGGGIENDGTLTMTNSIVAGNSASASTNGDVESSAGAVGAGVDGGITTGTNNILSNNLVSSGDAGPQTEDDCDLYEQAPPSCPTNGQNGNIVGASALLAPLGSYGGPTQTTPPLPGSPALCAGLVADIPSGVTTDQRGFPRTTTYGSNPACVDSGPVQTNYSVSFSTQPPASVAANTNFTAAVLLSESGSPFPVSGVSIPLALAAGDNGALYMSSLTTAISGIASSSHLQISAAGTGDTLLATLPITTVPPPTPLTSPIGSAATSSRFDVEAAAPSGTTTTLTTSAISVVVGSSVTFTASVSPSSTSPVPTGTIQFQDGSSPLGSPVALTASSASYATTALSAGTHTITAVYSGDTNFAPSTSAPMTETIEDVSTVLASPSGSVAPGGSLTEKLTVTAMSGSNALTTFACTGLPAGAHCSFDPASVTGSGSTTLTITTSGNTAALTPESGWLPGAGGGTALACILLFAWPNRRRRWAQMLGILLLASVFSTTGCGSSTARGGTGSSGTPTGTYTVTVTTTTGSGTTAIANTIEFQLTVT